MNELHRLLARTLKKTEAVRSEIEYASALVHQATHVLANHEDGKGQPVRERSLTFVNQMREQKANVEPLGEAIEHFCHSTDNFAGGLFHCYDLEGLPRTNNELETLLWSRTGL